ncbi:MAG: hypothetical protein CL910_01900 [Deltaproteobacteria bacterium]|nr:hypothetical protein [Deltaproteobacteria bacterium]
MDRVPGVAVVGCGHWGRNLVRVMASLDALCAVPGFALMLGVPNERRPRERRSGAVFAAVRADGERRCVGCDNRYAESAGWPTCSCV